MTELTPTDRIATIDALMKQYREITTRSPIQDIAIWHSLASIYHSPEDYDLVATSTKEEAFERMVQDNWRYSHDFYGIDYEILDDMVLDYVRNNKLMKKLYEEDEDE